LEIYQKKVSYLNRIYDILKKMAKINILIGLNRLELESKVRNQNKEKKREIIELDDNREETEKTEDTMKGVEKSSIKGVFSSPIP